MMRKIIRAVMAGAFLLTAGGVWAGQQPAIPAAAPAQSTAHVWLDPDGKPLPFKTDEEVMEFLRTAKIVSIKDIPVGVARPRKALLEKDGIRANAKFSSIHEQKDRVELAGRREFDFRDDAIFDCAAQELGKLLGMDNLPPVVQRTIGSEKGILQIWVEKSMTERDRLKDKVVPPDAIRWNFQIQTMRLFDNLVYNTDRNAGNIVIDKDWKIWLIDHTRAFRKYDDLPNARVMVVVNRGIWEKLLALDEGQVKERLKPYLRGFEIDAVLNRRKKIIEYFRAEIANRGESDVVREGK